MHLAEAQERVADAPAPGETTPSRTVFDEAYTSRTAPWMIGEPQPAIVALERSGWIRGRVLDPGCGTGEHTIHLTRLGYDVRGIDSSEHAIEQARGSQVSDTVIRDAFGEGWVLEDLRSSQYRSVIVGSTHAGALGRPVGDLVDLPVWLAPGAPDLTVAGLPLDYFCSAYRTP